MILFTASWDAPADLAAATRDALRGVAGLFPSLDGQPVHGTAWEGPAQVSWVGTGTPGASAVASDHQVAIVEGVCVHGPGDVLTADDVVGHDGGVDIGQLDDADGQFAVAVAKPDRLAIRNDPLGLMPLYWTRVGSAWLVANRVEVLARLVADRRVDLDAAGTFLSVGWVTGNRTLSPHVAVVPPGQPWTWRRGRAPRLPAARAPSELLPRDRQRFDSVELADVLVNRCQAVARWAGDVDAPLTAGLDSRLIMALLRAGGVTATYYTTGNDDSDDVIAARQLAQLTGVAHVVRPLPKSMDSWDVAARRAVGQNDGMVSLWQVTDTIATKRRPSLTFWGIGGEIARAFYTRPDYFLPRTRDAMLARFVSSRASDRHGLLTAAGLDAGRRAVRELTEQALLWGFQPIDVPDVFYTFERVSRWAGANARKLPWTTMHAPLATRTFAAAAFSVPAIARYSEPLHWSLLRQLAPDLHDFPVAKGGWRSQVPYVNLAQAAVRRLRRPAATFDGEHPRIAWLESLRGELAAQCLDQRPSPIWEIVDRGSFESLMLAPDGSGARRRAAETLYGIVTLFEYERLRSSPTWPAAC